MNKSILIGLALVSAPVFAQNAPQYGVAPPPLSATPYVFDTAEQHGIKVSVLAKGFARPFAILFLPDGDLLVTERGGDLRILRKATTAGAALDAVPVAGVPKPTPPGGNFGLHDLALHPDFARNHWLYFTYVEPVPLEAGAPAGTQRTGKLRLMRGKLEGGKLDKIETLAEGGASFPAGSRIQFGKDGKLWMTTGGPFGASAQDMTSIYGKVLRFNEDGTIPADNPFVGKDKANPAIYSLGHRDQHGLTIHPVTGQVFTAEHGPNGGDEVNLIKPGGNYGWPDFTYGQLYDGKEASALPLGPGIQKPVVLWNPSIAPSGLLFYQGDKFPGWKGNLFIGSGRRGEINGTGGLERVVFNADFGELRREALLGPLRKRVRDVIEGTDGNIYVLTDGDENAVLRIEPSGL